MDYISYIRSKVGHEKIILTFAGGILTNSAGEVLLQLRGDKKTWAISGGAMELGESSVDTLKREFLEETGVVVEPVRFLNAYTNFEEVYPNGDQVQTVVFLYEVAAQKTVEITDFRNAETLELRFFSPAEITGLDTISAKHRLMLDEFLNDSFAMGH
ncbi:NUDIX hydrolase [Streptococcus cuniculi]|uniref:NUDIX domain-containing protein n=1 Tax=Streptococcus cuniculi TaxID=1432788 RepID=A0A4Y9JD11_9STRE|nr:NUDIX domain-containing protein [Streptococcus cuniculi]MBF0777308.1 NUDIX domain-containing protein [Streptococcus cuniculi]TFU98910.1 NUDIX domain-containing protein [Streptococcus cuniculi]